VPADVWAAAELVNARRAQLAAANDAWRAARVALRACRAQYPLPAPAPQSAPGPPQPAPAGEPAPPAPEPEGDGQGAIPSLPRLLCGLPRVGHGHEGDPCRVRLGEDGACQYHG